MKIKYGTTRIVIILKRIVIKIPRIPILLFFHRLIKHSYKKDVKVKIKELNINSNFMFNYFIRGFKANYIEYKYSKNNPDKKGIIPVQSLLFGFLLIQPRGSQFSIDNKKWKKVLKKIVKNKINDIDMIISKNYSIWKGSICLHDYGSVKTIQNLALL